MNTFIGREQEQAEFRELLAKKNSSLVTCHGRRRIGKSRFIQQCAKQANAFFEFSGLPPRPGLTKKEQLTAFSEQLSKQSKAPPLPLDNWATAFQLLASQLPPKGTVVVLFDEISWMGIGEPDFAGYIKNAWDGLFSRRDRTVVVLCGSVSSWIEENILNNTGFVGRCSWQFHLGPLALSECQQFWGRSVARISTTEKLHFLAVTGGVPRYLEELDPKKTAEQNIARLCFHPSGMLFNEFGSIFSDIFHRRASNYREIVRALVDGAKGVDEISQQIGRERGGSLSQALLELVSAGFLTKDVSPKLSRGLGGLAKSKSSPSRQLRYRLSDNYLRFYLKYVEPHRDQIINGRFKTTVLEQLDQWDAIMGLQFENLVMQNLNAIFKQLRIPNHTVLYAGPYRQSKTQRQQGCQIDLLIQTKRSIYLSEIKLKRQISSSVIQEVDRKVAALNLPKNQSIRTVLIYNGELAPSIQEDQAFDFLIPASELFVI
ncbi:MAG: ATPase [Planctomycetota bacterium]|nr:ATPase [Planctomycetota bacterium]